MSRYLVIALVWVASLVAVGAWQNDAGINEQKVADQARFDKANNDIAEQKAQANAAYRAFQEHNVALMVERDQLKTTLEKEHEKNRIATDALRNKYAAASLRFAASQGAGSGDGGRSAQGAGIDSASSSAAAVVQLPDQITADLRRLSFDADELADNYRECYGYAQRVK